MPDRPILSQEAYEEMKQELEYLKTVKRTEIAQALESARALGDLRENAEYQEAREAQAALEERIRTLEETLRAAEIVSTTPSFTGGVVQVGSCVVVQKEGTEEKRELCIVSPHEANIQEGKISYESPLGEALLGKREGEVVEVATPSGAVRYHICALR